MSVDFQEPVPSQSSIRETKVAGPITINDILGKVSQEYDFGGNDPENLHPLHRGLETIKYTFWSGPELLLLKIYDREASAPPRFRLRNQPALENVLQAAGIPISKTVPTKDGKSFIVFDKPTTPATTHYVAAAISKIFPGNALQNPTIEDARAMAKYMAMMHQIKDYGVVPAMDSWSLLRLVTAFDRDKGVTELQNIRDSLASTVNEVKTLELDDGSKFPKALVHGDLHPFNILKDQDKYCILDLGCMDHEQRIADLAIFMSNTCADFTNAAKTKELFRAVVDTYERQVQLTPSERAALPLLIQANYAMFALRTAELLQNDPNNGEVKQFHELGMNGMRFMQGLELK